MIKTRDMIILGALACLSLIISLVTHSGSRQIEQYRVKTLLRDASIHFDAISMIDINRDGLHLHFEKVDDAWWQQLPFPMRMDHPAMLALIEVAQGVQVLGEVSADQHTEGLGLGDDANTISFSDGTSSVSIRLGRKTLGGLGYATLDENRVVLVDQSLHNLAIDMDHRIWRDIRLFPEFAIDGIRIEREVDGDRMLLERHKGRWVMREPVSSRVEQSVLITWVGRLAAARVGSWVVDEPSDLHLFGLDLPSAIFEVGDRHGHSDIVFIGGRVSAGSQDRYMMLAGRPVVFTMKWDTVSQLFPLPEILIDSTGSGVSRFDAKQVTIRSNHSEIILQRDLDRWVNKSSDDANVDSNEVDALLNWVLDTKALSIAIGQYPLEQEVATVVFAGYDLLPIDSVRIAKTADGEWILENGDNVLRLHAPETGDALAPFLN